MSVSIADFLTTQATSYGSSRWGTLAHCPEAYHLAYTEGVALRFPPNFFGVGTIVHAGQAWQLAGHGKWSDVLDYLRIRQTHAEDGALTDGKILDEAERLLDCYYAHWGDDGGWGPAEESQVIAVEQELVGQIGTSFYSVRADHIRRHYDRIVAIDTKTKAQSPSGAERIGTGLIGLDEYTRNLATRPQFLGLSWLVGEVYNSGEPVTLIDDLIIKTKMPAFARVEITFTREMIAEWQAEHLKLLAVDRRKNLHACAPDHARRCGYFDWCHGTDEMRNDYYERKK